METLYLYVLDIVDDSDWMGRLDVCQMLSAVMPATAFGWGSSSASTNTSPANGLLGLVPPAPSKKWPRDLPCGTPC